MDLVESIDDISADPQHVRMLSELAEDVGGEFLEQVKAKGVIQAYKDNRESFLASMRGSDGDAAQWERFIESQNKALANRTVPTNATTMASTTNEHGQTAVAVLREEARTADEVAIAD
ncbi:hypothetical protein NQ176_g7285 [Zarea fungicola]|uniref:Uncharacterized protein n=1 Tax=Zarea fungicola TaxID=93591 RepID=A0ACC1N187_9HYPO|nr:hypothetical protein NQ176_g7285 [Lecanicillium fungicola]